jgi:hypothetical protein
MALRPIGGGSYSSTASTLLCSHAVPPILDRRCPPGELTADDRIAIRAVIERQLEVFALASPEIQAKYGSPENFMTIVKTFYEPIYRPRRMGGFTKLHVIDGQPTQPVLLVGPDGDFAVALYTMTKQVHGEWKILGCSLIP